MKLFLSSLFISIFLGVFFIVFDFFFDGLGNSKVSGYFDYYQGSASYSDLHMTIRPESTRSAEDLDFKTLNYGSRLKNKAIVKAEILASEVPLDQIEYIFYDTVDFQLPLSKDSVYVIWVSHSSNQYSFIFQSKKSFEITGYTSYPADSIITPLEIDTKWSDKYWWYCICCFLQTIFFTSSFCTIIVVYKLKGWHKALPILPFICFVLSASYIAYIDFPHNSYPIMSPILAFALLVLFVVLLFVKDDKIENV